MQKKLLTPRPLVYIIPWALHKYLIIFKNSISVKDPAKRLGGGPSDAREIKNHDFFEPINWDELEQKKVILSK